MQAPDKPPTAAILKQAACARDQVQLSSMLAHSQDLSDVQIAFIHIERKSWKFVLILLSRLSVQKRGVS